MNTFSRDAIKIQYTREGYLPNYPYHMISDEEMCDAFIKLPEDIQEYITSDFFGPDSESTKLTVDWFQSYLNSTDIMYFKDHYPLIDESIRNWYKELVNRIFYEIQEFKNNLSDDRELPNWVYSYMFGVAIGPASDKLDIHAMISSPAMGTDNLYDDYNLPCAIECYRISKDWLRRLIVPEGETQRPPTMFGEPHVLKSIRLFEEALLPEDLPKS